jgi:hypothetical protein
MVEAGHYALTNKKGGKTVVTGTADFSADGNTRTLTTEMTDASGRRLTSIAVRQAMRLTGRWCGKRVRSSCL